MKKRALAFPKLDKSEYTLELARRSTGGKPLATIKGLCDDKFPIGSMYFLKDPIQIKCRRINEEYIELFPFANSPKLYNEGLLEQHHAVELCEKFGVSHPYLDGLVIFLSKEHVFVFVKVSNGEPSKELLQAIKAFCDDKGIEWLPAEQIEVKYPDLFA